ncbi:putative receptor protein kinase ZmPK1 [Prunus avium]|uniref:Receptor-like serine/threonine-protein kinase n=1 Tax=Prunus avium TaxID=42229 RepID=A0A6P5T1U7_PRUAV|nr:putative receptor protein kinase ZmPK1 [Prunus avium]
MAGTCFFLILLSLALFSPLAVSSASYTDLSAGSSLSVENPADTLTSSNGMFSAGFFQVGENAYSFAIWFTEPSPTHNLTVVWMSNRDQPVNGRGSKLILQKDGNLILTDAGKSTIWSSNTVSNSFTKLILHDNGNLVLLTLQGLALWESFASPTNTLLPQQPLTRNTKLISSRSLTNYSSGFYSFYFDNDNTLRILYSGPELSSIYWPDPWRTSWEAGRSTYNNSRIAMFDHLGSLSASDNFSISSVDYGAKLQRILKMDADGNVRLYSRTQQGATWVVSWQAISVTCKIHGICGANSWCSHVPSFGRKCSCLPGYEMRNKVDWSYGCQPQPAGDHFNLSWSCTGTSTAARYVFGFMHLPHVEFYGYDYGFYSNYTLERCKVLCLELCNCAGFQYKYAPWDGIHNCFPKVQLENGRRTPGFDGDLYLKLPKSILSSYNASAEESNYACSDKLTRPLDRTYEKSGPNGSVKFMLKLASGLGGAEIVCVFLVWYFVSRRTGREREDSEVVMHGYLHAATGFRRFSYSELKKATRGFIEVIGRGGGGTVYKGLLSDQRVAAIKQLNGANQGEAEFLAEVSLIGKLYHMNLIEMWGYCVEGKHRLLVYEYMEHGSLAEKLSSNGLDWKQKFEIAVGTAKGLAYLHEECLEWVLHCDIKPQNILLHSNYNPKVADFGLSKLLNRGEQSNFSFSRVRGTRGYVAPEWVQNIRITSKADVYSYGIVVLEMLTGKSPAESVQAIEGGEETHEKMMVTWVREKMNGAFANAESQKGDDYEQDRLEILVKVALQCLEEDKDARPNMSQVVEMLLHHENN